MKRRFILYRRKRGGMFYVEDTETHKQESTGTRNRAEATALLNARNEAVRQPQLNRQIAKAYLAGTDSGISTRTWQDAFNAIIEYKRGTTQDRWRRGARQKAFDLIHRLVIIETQAEQLLACMKAGTVSTNILLRELHNYCLAMNWLAWPIIPRRLWPKIEYGPKRAITAEEHLRIVALDTNIERRAFFELCWHLGGSQSDIANLAAENIDWSDRVIAYARRKTGSPAFIHFGPASTGVCRPRLLAAVTEAAGIGFVGGRVAFKIGAGQIVEQHVELRAEEIAPAPAQRGAEGGLVFEQTIQTAIERVVLGGAFVRAEQIGAGGGGKPVPVGDFAAGVFSLVKHGAG